MTIFFLQYFLEKPIDALWIYLDLRYLHYEVDRHMHPVTWV